MTNLSKSQVNVLNFIYYHLQKYGYAPSHREIAKACHIGSTSTVSRYLGQLHKAGLIHRQTKLSRAISATRKGRLSAEKYDANAATS